MNCSRRGRKALQRSRGRADRPRTEARARGRHLLRRRRPNPRGEPRTPGARKLALEVGAWFSLRPGAASRGKRGARRPEARSRRAAGMVRGSAVAMFRPLARRGTVTLVATPGRSPARLEAEQGAVGLPVRLPEGIRCRLRVGEVEAWLLVAAALECRPNSGELPRQMRGREPDHRPLCAQRTSRPLRRLLHTPCGKRRKCPREHRRGPQDRSRRSHASRVETGGSGAGRFPVRPFEQAR